MSDEAIKTDDKPYDERIDKLPGGMNQKLMKSWRLKIPMMAGKLEVGLYIEPVMGLFYARVPENEDGTLCVSDALPELRKQVRPLLKELSARGADLEQQDRVWERRIRIRYTGGSQVYGDLLEGNPETLWARRRKSSMPIDASMCTQVGTLTFSRYERSVQPGTRRYDVREWLEDFEERTVQWEDSLDEYSTQDEHRRDKPTLARTVWNINPHMFGKKVHRDVPWRAETWSQLTVMSARFERLHNALHSYLVDIEEDVFLEQLSRQPDRLLTVREA